MNRSVTVAPRGTKPQTPDDRPLRILHVLDHSLPLHSGYTFRTLAILRQQHALGWQTFQLTGSKQGGGAEREQQIDDWLFYRTPRARSPFARLPLIRFRYVMQALRRRLAEVVERTQPDILHAHSPVLNAIPALSVGRANGIPVVYEVRAFWEDAAVDLGTAHEWGPRYRLTRAMETRALKRADAVTTICDGLCGEMQRRGIPAERITVIPNAVDTSLFHKEATDDAVLREKYGLTLGQTLGFAGSFYAYEGLDLLLQAMPRVLAVVPGVRVLLLGGGPQDAALRALAVRLGVSDAVHFVGRVPHADIQRYYSAMDIMVYPRVSRRLTELVTPLKPLEAMAMSKLVVASDVGGHRELIRDGHTGCLFRAGSVEALAQRLVGLLTAPNTWDRMICEGRSFVERERTWQASVERYRDVYADALKRCVQREAKRHGG